MVLLPSCEPTQCGKEFRANIRKPSNAYRVKHHVPRVVPAFTIQALQKNTIVKPPPKTVVFKEIKYKTTPFRKAYLKGELPVMIEFTNFGKHLLWKTSVEKLDVCYYLPIFFYGLSEGVYPFDFIVENGVKDILKKNYHRILPCVPQLISPLKAALATKNARVICLTNNCIRIMVEQGENVGVALVPYYRKLLPTLGILLVKNRETRTDQPVIRHEDVWYSIEDTLNVLERYGGPDAFINIKYYIPNYESCVMN